MNGIIEIKSISEDIINVLGTDYYTESYLKEMMRREYERGKKEGQNIHIAQIEECSNCVTLREKA